MRLEPLRLVVLGVFSPPYCLMGTAEIFLLFLSPTIMRVNPYYFQCQSFIEPF